MNSRANAGKLLVVGVLVLLGAIISKPNVVAAHSYSTGHRSNVSSWNKYNRTDTQQSNQPSDDDTMQSDAQAQQPVVPVVNTQATPLTQEQKDPKVPCPTKTEEQPKEKPCPKPVETPKPCPKPVEHQPEHKPCPKPEEPKKPCPKPIETKPCPVHHTPKPCPPIKTPCPTPQPPVTPPVTPPQDGGKGSGPLPTTPVVTAAAVTTQPQLADTGTNAVVTAALASAFIAAAAFVATRRTKVSK